MKKKLSFILLLVLFVVACSSDNDKKEVIDDLKIELLKDGEIIDGSIEVDAKSILNLSVVTNFDTEIKTYEWILNGEPIDGAVDKEYKFALGLSGVLKVLVELEDSRTASAEIKLVGPFKDGTFFFGTTEESLSFMSSDTKFYDNNVYDLVNGKYQGKGGINDMQIFNNKLYILSPSSASQKAQLAIVDAQTLKEIDVVTAEHFNARELGEIYNLLVISDEKAYIGHNKSSSGNISGVRVLNIKEKTFSSADLDGTSGKLGVDGPAWARMKYANGKAFIACGSKIQVLDTTTDAVIKTIELHKDRQVVDLLSAKDKTKLYALVNGEEDKSNPMWLMGYGSGTTTPASFVEIDLSDFSISETELILDNKEIKIKGGLGASFSIGSPIANEIYFSDKDDNTLIYKFNIDDKSISVFVNTTEDTNATGLNGYMGIDNNGVLYIPYSGKYSYQNESIISFDTNSGKLINKDIETMPGEANALSTAMFN